jgi:ubiquinone/menaquinone biosynthesis C-methylase UbiE
MSFQWPIGFERCPKEDWAETPLEELALNYDTVEEHGWYDNLDTTVELLIKNLNTGDIIIDYSGGTGILSQRLLNTANRDDFGILIVDSSPKFLRLALEKFHDNEQVSFRLIKYLRDEKRLQLLDEVLTKEIIDYGIYMICSTNAIHLYNQLDETLTAWHRVLRPNGRIHIQSGNIRNPSAGEDTWIIDETVEHIHRAAMKIVLEQPEWADYAMALEDEEYMKSHDVLRDKYFLPVRPIDTYLDALTSSGFQIDKHMVKTIPAIVEEWYSFLSVYHEGVLGWVGGAERITGKKASEDVIEERKKLIRISMNRIFSEEDSFQASWTYIEALKSV